MADDLVKYADDGITFNDAKASQSDQALIPQLLGLGLTKDVVYNVRHQHKCLVTRVEDEAKALIKLVIAKEDAVLNKVKGDVTTTEILAPAARLSRKPSGLYSYYVVGMEIKQPYGIHVLAWIV